MALILIRVYLNRCWELTIPFHQLISLAGLSAPASGSVTRVRSGPVEVEPPRHTCCRTVRSLGIGLHVPIEPPLAVGEGVRRGHCLLPQVGLRGGDHCYPLRTLAIACRGRHCGVHAISSPESLKVYIFLSGKPLFSLTASEVRSSRPRMRPQSASDAARSLR